MSRTDAILSKGKKLYEDDTYILLWTKFFGLSLLALTSYYVYVKPKKRLTKLNGREKTYLISVSFYLTKQHGVKPRAVIDETSLFGDFSQAIADRGGDFYKNFFKENAKDKAKSYALQSSRKGKKPKS